MPDLAKITTLIERIYPELESLKGDYCIIGSSALLLCGIDVPIHDFDILTSAISAQRLKIAWSKNLNPSYRPESPDRFRSIFARYDFEELPVEVMGDLEVKQNDWVRVEVKNTIRVSILGKFINIPTKKELVRIFQLLGREKDLEKVKLLAGH